MEALLLNLAPTGLLPTRAQTPHVPLSAEEVAADCARCCALGVTMLHLHARAASLTLEDQARARLATNQQLVQRIVDRVAALGRPLASADQVRRRLGLAPRP